MLPRVTSEGNPIRFKSVSDPRETKRKALNASGRLGAFYDTNYDRIINQNLVLSLPLRERIQRAQCALYSDRFSNHMLDYLEMIINDQALFQSLLLEVIRPSGIGHLINDMSLIDEKLRVFHYIYYDHCEKLSIRPETSHIRMKQSASRIKATHLITEMTYGFEILSVMKVKDASAGNRIDAFLGHLLDKINHEPDLDLTQIANESNAAQEIEIVSMYGSKAFSSDSITVFAELLKMISKWQKREKHYYYPLEYRLNSLQWLYDFPRLVYCSNFNDIQEPTLVMLTDTMKRIRNRMTDLIRLFNNDSFGILKRVLQKQYDTLQEQYRRFQYGFRVLLIRLRQNRLEDAQRLLMILQQDFSGLEESSIDHFCIKAQRLSNRDLWISQLVHGQMEYFHVDELEFHRDHPCSLADIDIALSDRFSENSQDILLWYSNDQLEAEKMDEWNEYYQRVKSHQSETTKVIYVDFTLSICHLEEFLLRTLQKKTLPKPQELTVLVLGETGAGKSTFINAFVNYLVSESLEDAEKAKPIALIPSSFLITVGKNFDEIQVNIGDPDPNEDYSQPGSSVTQHCMSYIIPLRPDLHLRLIDTPGMGDTRGIEQDAINIDHILTYLSAVPELNAVCFVLRPNVSRLDIFFRSCLQQLFTYLTPNAYPNIIFCFTNARTTFYAPGQTGPSLRHLLQQHNLLDIPFGKKNVFCFDNESFRYLAMVQQGVPIDEIEREEFLKSWTKSVKESVRLVNYIRSVDAYALNRWRSARRTTLDIVMLARPLIEQLRYMIYQTIDPQLTVQWSSTNEKLCSQCALRKRVQLGSLFVYQYGPEKRDDQQACSCPHDGKRFFIESIVEYRHVSNAHQQCVQEESIKMNDFLWQCDQLAYFIRQTRTDDHPDPFQSILDRYLEDEVEHCCAQSGDTSNANGIVLEQWRSVRVIRKGNMDRLVQSNRKWSLEEVIEVMERLTAISGIREHIECIKMSRQIQMTNYERFITIEEIKNPDFLRVLQ